ARAVRESRAGDPLVVAFLPLAVWSSAVGPLPCGRFRPQGQGLRCYRTLVPGGRAAVGAAGTGLVVVLHVVAVRIDAGCLTRGRLCARVAVGRVRTTFRA